MRARRAAPVERPAVRRVVVKFRDEVVLPYEDHVERLPEFPGELLRRWMGLPVAPGFAPITLRRLFTTVPPGRIRELVARARSLDPTYVPTDFLKYFVMDCAPGQNPAGLAEALHSWPQVEHAYVEDRPAPPPAVTPDDEPYYGNQRYLDDEDKVGVAVSAAWATPGGDGDVTDPLTGASLAAGVGFADVETGWWLDHPDLVTTDALGNRAPVVQREVGSSTTDRYTWHGTAVLGIVLAQDNGEGCIGIVPKLRRAHAVSEYRKDLTALSGEVRNPPDAILSAIDLLRYGDVLLLESQRSVGRGAEDYLPVEHVFDATDQGHPWKTAFREIRLATALGIAVVEAAGDGREVTSPDGRTATVGNDLDQFARFNVADPEFADSGAILVAAGTKGVPHERLPSSNYGTRVDCYAWGEDVQTLDSPDAVPPYNDSFNETSSAAAIIAGVALAVQSMAVQIQGRALSAWQLRALLRDPALGTPSEHPFDWEPAAERDLIGVMPRLDKIVGRLQQRMPDLFLRDFVGDGGGDEVGPLCMSPDLIVRRAAVTDPQGAFGESSAFRDDVALSEEVLAGQDHYVYVRVRNRGLMDSTQASADVYWSEPATLVDPTRWRLIGTTPPLASVPGANVLEVFDAIQWPAQAVPATGHYCFVALVSCAEDPAPLPADFQNWDFFVQYVARNNNVTWRNFNVVAPSTSAPGGDGGKPAYELPFHIAGPWDRARRMRVELDTDLPAGTTIEFEPSRRFLGRLHTFDRFVAGLTGRPYVRLAVPRGRPGLLMQGLLEKGLRESCVLRVRLPRAASRRAYRIAVRQVYEDLEVGRITWRLAR
jgi:hypothetical protein